MSTEIEDLLCRAAEAASVRNSWAARWHYRKAERLSRAAGLPRLRAQAAQKLAGLACRHNRFAEALTNIEIAIESWGQAQEPVWRAVALLDRADILEKANRLHDARLAYRESRAAMVEVGRSYDVLRCDSAIEGLGDRIARQARADRRIDGAKAARDQLLKR